MNIKRTKLWLFTTTVILVIAFVGGCKKPGFEEINGVCPVVLSTSPVNLEEDVQLDKIVTVTFNEPMHPVSFTSTSFVLKGSEKVPGIISLDKTGTIMSFDPDSNLDPNTTYTGTVYATVRDKMGSALQIDYIWTFSTIDTLTPKVIATDPVNVALNVSLNKVITATFSMPMDSLSINASTFIVRNGSVVIAGKVSYQGVTATFTPNIPLAENTVYTGAITNDVKNPYGIHIAKTYIWTFRTVDPTTPYVTLTDPDNNETNVGLNQIVRATFSMPMDPATINSSTFTVKQGVNNIPGAITYTGTVASFTPNSNLSNNLVYTATVTTGATNTNGVAMAAPHVWTFSTPTPVPVSPQVILTNPDNNETGVAINSVVRATFNMQMDPSTINSTTYTLKQGVTNIPGIVSYTGTVATFTPNSNLLHNTTYTATVTTGAKSNGGVAMAASYIWTFQTIPAPFVGIDLKTVGRFGIIAGTGVSNNAGFSVINNLDVGISPGVRSSITGFPPATIVNGAIYASDDIAPPGVAAMLIQAKQDLADVYNFLEGATLPAPAIVSGDQGGLTLAPGIYKTASTLLIQNGNLTLDGQGDPNATWIFQIGAAFTTVGGAGGSIILTGGAQAKNVFWQVGSSATIGDNTIFKGNILALTSITMNSGAVAEGRMLARNGAVVMTNTNIINKP